MKTVYFAIIIIFCKLTPLGHAESHQLLLHQGCYGYLLYLTQTFYFFRSFVAKRTAPESENGTESDPGMVFYWAIINVLTTITGY